MIWIDSDSVAVEVHSNKMHLGGCMVLCGLPSNRNIRCVVPMILYEKLNFSGCLVVLGGYEEWRLLKW